MLLEQPPQRVAAEWLVIGNHLDDACEVGEHVALIPVGKNRGHCGVVELNIEIVHLDEVDSRMLSNKGPQS